jgi:hypothetical protein
MEEPMLRITRKSPSIVIGILALLLAAAYATIVGVNASARQVIAPRVETLRFQLIGDEPVAAPDGRGLVGGWSVLMFRDRSASQCYLVFKEGAMLSAATAVSCP